MFVLCTSKLKKIFYTLFKYNNTVVFCTTLCVLRKPNKRGQCNNNKQHSSGEKKGWKKLVVCCAANHSGKAAPQTLTMLAYDGYYNEKLLQPLIMETEFTVCELNKNRLRQCLFLLTNSVSVLLSASRGAHQCLAPPDVLRCGRIRRWSSAAPCQC